MSACRKKLIVSISMDRVLLMELDRWRQSQRIQVSRSACIDAAVRDMLRDAMRDEEDRERRRKAAEAK